MTITIDLPESISQPLEEAGISAEQAGRFVLSELSRVAKQAEQDDNSLASWWAHLTEDEREHERVLTAESIGAGDAGRVRSMKQVLADLRGRSASSQGR